VEDGLPGLRIAVEHRPVAAIRVSILAREGRGTAHHLADELIVVRGQIVEGGDVPARHDEDVHRRLRIDVPERDHPLVGMDDVCRDVPSRDPAEQAVCHVTS